MVSTGPTHANEAPAVRRSTRRGRLIALLVVFAIVAGLVGLIVWAVLSTRQPDTPVAPARAFEDYEPAWASAMAKAGVTATFPPSPVDVELLQTSGSVSFEATFTAEEITALVNVYPYRNEAEGDPMHLGGISVGFPAEGIGRLAGRLTVSGSTYDARIEGPIGYSATGIDSPGATSLAVEGFDVKGVRRDQATAAVVAYLNAYVRAAPGLVLERAQIVEGGLEVRGSAPQRIVNP